MSQKIKLNSYLSSKSYLNFSQLLTSNRIIRIAEDLPKPKPSNFANVFSVFSLPRQNY